MSGEWLRSASAAIEHRVGAVVVSAVLAAVTLHWIVGSWPVTAAAFAAALCAVSAGVVLVRTAKGKLSEADAAGQVERYLGIPAATIRSGDDRFALSLLRIASTLQASPSLTVLQLGHPSDCDIAVDLNAAGELLGDRRRRLRELTRGCRETLAVNEIGSASHGPSLYTLRTPDVTVDDLERLRKVPGPSVMVIDTARATWSHLVRTRQILDAIGCDVRAVIVWTGRLPHDPAEPWDPTSTK